jgi:hypothetical protein
MTDEAIKVLGGVRAESHDRRIRSVKPTAQDIVLSIAKLLRICDNIGDVSCGIEQAAEAVGVELPDDWRNLTGDQWTALNVQEIDYYQRRARVFKSLDNAEANGYPQRDLPVDQIACDIGTCDADLEGLEVEELRPHIEAWLSDALLQEQQ